MNEELKKAAAEYLIAVFKGTKTPDQATVYAAAGILAIDVVKNAQ